MESGFAHITTNESKTAPRVEIQGSLFFNIWKKGEGEKVTGLDLSPIFTTFPPA